MRKLICCTLLMTLSLAAPPAFAGWVAGLRGAQEAQEERERREMERARYESQIRMMEAQRAAIMREIELEERQAALERQAFEQERLEQQNAEGGDIWAKPKDIRKWLQARGEDTGNWGRILMRSYTVGTRPENHQETVHQIKLDQRIVAGMISNMEQERDAWIAVVKAKDIGGDTITDEQRDIMDKVIKLDTTLQMVYTVRENQKKALVTLEKLRLEREGTTASHAATSVSDQAP